MKRRVRKTVKWGGAVLTVLLLVVWIGSGWIRVARVAPLSHAEIVDTGCFKFIFMRGSGLKDQTYWSCRGGRAVEFNWAFQRTKDGYLRELVIPLWCPTLLSLLATAAAWRADSKYLRRVRVGLCAGCGYDRAGLAAGAVCPECGVAAVSKVRRGRGGLWTLVR